MGTRGGIARNDPVPVAADAAAIRIRTEIPGHLLCDLSMVDVHRTDFRLPISTLQYVRKFVHTLRRNRMTFGIESMRLITGENIKNVLYFF